MTNNLEDFEQPELPPEPLQRRGVGSNLANAWRSQPLFKLFVLMVVVGAIVAVSVSFFSNGSNRTNTVGLIKPPELNEAPGGKASPYMKEQTELANTNRTQEAIKSGGSALPTPLGQTADSGELNAAAKNEQLNELRAEVETMNKQLQQTKQTQQYQQIQQAEPTDDTLAQAMQHQMTQLMDSWTAHGIKEVTVIKTDEKKEEAAKEAAAAQAVQQAANTPKTVVPAGTVSYAQLLTEANSDVPGPILAQIVSGPLAGARAVGQFQVANGNADYLVLQFNLANVKGKDYAMNAIALDPDTTLGGMATEVDQRYFTRVILPAAAGFLQGFGSALGQGNSSVVTNGTTTIVQQSNKGISQGAYTGLGQAAQTASQFFQNQANQTRPLVRVAAGTPIGMFFVASVLDTQAQQGGLMTTAGPGYPGGYTQSQPYGSYPAAMNTGYYNNGSTYGQGNASNIPYPNYGTAGYSNYGAQGYGNNPAINPYYNGGYTGGAYNGTNTGALMTPASPGTTVYYPH
jgi:intracellular multiplication protein IcmE